MNMARPTAPSERTQHEVYILYLTKVVSPPTLTTLLVPSGLIMLLRAVIVAMWISSVALSNEWDNIQFIQCFHIYTKYSKSTLNADMTNFKTNTFHLYIAESANVVLGGRLREAISWLAKNDILFQRSSFPKIQPTHLGLHAVQV